MHLDTLDGHHLKLRNLGAEEAGGSSGLVIGLGKVRPLAVALLDATAEVERQTQGKSPLDWFDETDGSNGVRI